MRNLSDAEIRANLEMLAMIPGLNDMLMAEEFDMDGGPPPDRDAERSLLIRDALLQMQSAPTKPRVVKSLQLDR